MVVIVIISNINDDDDSTSNNDLDGKSNSNSTVDDDSNSNVKVKVRTVYSINYNCATPSESLETLVTQWQYCAPLFLPEDKVSLTPILPRLASVGMTSPMKFILDILPRHC